MAEKIVCNPDVFASRVYPEKSKRRCFVIMPFKSETEADKRIQDVYNHHILPVAKKCGLDCTRADDKRYFRNGKPIMEQVWRAICEADIIIGEFTTANPNVTYEAGIAHTLGKPLIGIVQSMKDVPFDYRHLRFITYSTTHDGFAALDSDLETEITAYMNEIEERYPQRPVSNGVSVEEFAQFQQERDSLLEKLCEQQDNIEVLQDIYNSFYTTNKYFESKINDLQSTIKVKDVEIARLKQKLAVKPVPKPKLDLKPGDIYRFGPYDWRVLDVQSNRVLLLTKNIIETRRYHASSGDDCKWAGCEMRQYLNGEFLQKISSHNRARIYQVSNNNPDNQWFGTKGGQATQDKVFLLSIEEAAKCFGDSGKLKYKNPQKQYWIDNKHNDKMVAKYEGNDCSWWLRSPGYGSSSAAYVSRNGTLNVGGYIMSAEGGVRPALWLNLEA